MKCNLNNLIQTFDVIDMLLEMFSKRGITLNKLIKVKSKNSFEFRY